MTQNICLWKYSLTISLTWAPGNYFSFCIKGKVRRSTSGQFTAKLSLIRINFYIFSKSFPLPSLYYFCMNVKWDFNFLFSYLVIKLSTRDNFYQNLSTLAPSFSLEKRVTYFTPPLIASILLFKRKMRLWKRNGR